MDKIAALTRIMNALLEHCGPETRLIMGEAAQKIIRDLEQELQKKDEKKIEKKMEQKPL